MNEDKTKTALWDSLKTPPPDAVKKIEGGRLKNMHDIKPQWRYQIMTQVFGPCGVGWKYSIDKVWNELGADNEVLAFAQVSVYIKQGTEWSEPIPGLGGSKLIAKEKQSLHNSDEAYKMAVTDALGTALKMLGVAADVYMGQFDGKHSKSDEPSQSEGFEL